jgi:oligopeptide transport system permease protein
VALFILRRVLWTIPVILLAIALTFLLVKQLPPPYVNNPKLAPAVKQNLLRIYGLDKPVYTQYLLYVRDLARGDFGLSTKPNTSEVGPLIRDTFPVSAALGAMAFTFAALLGSMLGMVSAMYVNRWPDHLITFVSTIFFALPIFVLCRYAVEYFPEWSIGWETPQSKVMPVLVLGLSLLPYFVRLVRASMLETLQQEYVAAARAKGLPWRRLVFRHVLRNSLIPAVTSAGPLLGFLLTGSFIVERIHYIPGIGGEFIRAFSDPLDINMILGTTILVSVAIIVANLAVDIIIGWLDPRITHE